MLDNFWENLSLVLNVLPCYHFDSQYILENFTFYKSKLKRFHPIYEHSLSVSIQDVKQAPITHQLNSMQRRSIYFYPIVCKGLLYIND